MPETIRAANERLRSRPWRDGFVAAYVIATIVGTCSEPAAAETRVGVTALAAFQRAIAALREHEMTALTLVLALLGFALIATVFVFRAHRSNERIRSEKDDEIAGLQADLDRLKALLFSQPQVLVSWPANAENPEILGDTGILTAGGTPDSVLPFRNWVEPAAARRLEQAVDKLRSHGRGFAFTVTSRVGRPVEIDGRVIGGRAIVRLRDVGGIEEELLDLAARHDELLSNMETIRSLLDSLPAPVWARDDNGRLIFVNSAYARAVEADSSVDAVDRGLELLDQNARTEVARARSLGEPYSGRLPLIVAGLRRSFDVIDVPTTRGRSGIAIDRTEQETMRAELARMVDAHRRVLDQLATGVAVYDVDRKLIFYNAAFRSLFELDAGVLDQSPTDAAVLDALRSKRKLPEEHDFRQWKQQLYEAYRAVEAKEHMWHLPDGRTLRVVTTPNPEGGVTYLYDDVTERLDMHRRYDALIKVQSETLDHLAEAVAVFGSDGRVRLHNPAFQRMWKLSREALDERPHVEAVTAWCHALHDDSAVWRKLRATVTAIDNREPIAARIERRDGAVIELATVPLPDGATLVAFQDTTDTVNVERALRERNEALETANSIKIDFVHHVSYELRSPLTNIIGFANLLGDPAFGPLNKKQSEYLGYITASTNALLALINNILDLATIDAGAMTLSLAEVDIRASMEAAAEGVQDRLAKNRIKLDLHSSAGIGTLVADERRLRQILFNLLSNAVGFSPPGESITFSAERRGDAVVFRVTDRGPGIAPEVKDKVFDWFETDTRGSQHRGPGLGLSLVRSFVELHGGTVTIESARGKGTTVNCVFPARPSERRTAA
ncbi:MAG TPA: PAS-domain containing protein [Pseudolabrys sp.]|nr:PAS-domain containing protein [Pseudolabrys sp.]